MIKEDIQQYSNMLKDLSYNDKVLAESVLSDINQAFYAEGVDGTVSNAFDLSVRYVTADQYHDVVTGIGTFEPKTLYVVSSDELNAYNTNIRNVKDPSREQDAANKRYVDSAVSNAVPTGVALLSAANEFEKP